MAFDFPNAPTTGQNVSGPNGAVWQWDGSSTGMPEFAETSAGFFAIGRVGFCRTIECAEMDDSSGAKTTTESTGGECSYAFRKATHSPLVLHILCVAGRSQIDPTVVVSDAIDVIDLRRFFVCDHLENDAVRRPKDAIELNKRISGMMFIPGDCSRISRIPSFPLSFTGKVNFWATLPSQNAGSLFVYEADVEIDAGRQSPDRGVQHARFS